MSPAAQALNETLQLERERERRERADNAKSSADALTKGVLVRHPLATPPSPTSARQLSPCAAARRRARSKSS